jgi:hypothetical protein
VFLDTVNAIQGWGRGGAFEMPQGAAGVPLGPSLGRRGSQIPAEVEPVGEVSEGVETLWRHHGRRVMCR